MVVGEDAEGAAGESGRVKVDTRDVQQRGNASDGWSGRFMKGNRRGSVVGGDVEVWERACWCVGLALALPRDRAAAADAGIRAQD